MAFQVNLKTILMVLAFGKDGFKVDYEMPFGFLERRFVY